jgi:hypothetical protein
VASSPPSARPTEYRSSIAALIVAIAAFVLYRATLLPGFDFGDTGAFQTMAGSPYVTPRDGYPLYFAIADTVAAAVRGDPARAFNLASAIEGAAACGVMVLVGVELSGSIAAATASAALFAVSYTFWSQAVIAEVYALHLALVGVTLLLLLHWSNRPSLGRLAAFFGVYALAFGNHLSTILLAPGFAVFLLAKGGRSMLTPRVVLLAATCAAAGALQYAWNIRTLWFLEQPPHGPVDALARFWFDVTKSDWRDTMVLNVPGSMLRDHAAMYWFDLRQQFGIAGPVVAAAGLALLATIDMKRAILMALLFAANVMFAYSYNVGDAHVFYLPSHFIVALLVAPGIVAAGRLTPSAVPIAASLVGLYAVARGVHDFPALDRSNDMRPAAVIAALTQGLDDQRAILLTDLNWQVQNGLSAYTAYSHPEIAVGRMPDVLVYLPALTADNHAVGREVALTERAAGQARAAFGPLAESAVDERVRVASLSEIVRDLSPGTRYALCVLKPSRDMTLDTEDLTRALRILSGESIDSASGDYFVAAGIKGRPPGLVEGSNLPFSRRVQLDGVETEVRMESWLAADTIRRMGFGHVVAARQHTLIVERGVSFVAFGADGKPIRTAYAANIFAPQRRYLLW